MMLWIDNLLGELFITNNEPFPVHYNNQAATHIACNLVPHERTKHIKVDCHFICETVMK